MFRQTYTQKCIRHGKNREEIVYEKIRKCFKGLEESSNIFSFYDYFLRKENIFLELKSLTKNKSQYCNAIMNLNKIQRTDLTQTYRHFIFIFEYPNEDKTTLETHNLFYHIYDHTRVYNERVVYPDGVYTEVIDIPMTDLTPLDCNSEYCLESFTTHITDQDRDIFNKCLTEKDFFISTNRLNY